MEELERRFEALYHGLETLRPVNLASAGMSDMLGVESLGHEMLKALVKLRNPEAAITRMEGTVGGLLVSSNKKKGRAGLDTYLSDFEPLPLLPGFQFYTPASEFEMVEALQSYYMNNLTEEQKNKVYARIPEGKSGAPVRLYNLVPMVILAIGRTKLLETDYLTVPFRFLRFCSQTWGDGRIKNPDDPHSNGDECDDPPYGRIRVTVDSMSPKKVYMCLNMANILNNYKDVIDYLAVRGISMALLAHEMLSFLSCNPIGRTLKLKGPLGLMYMHSSALATSGSYIQVPNAGSWRGYTHVVAPSVSVDHAFWDELYGKDFREGVKYLSENGLTQLAKLARECIRFPLNGVGHRAATFISALRGVCGYVGTDNNISFDEAYDHKKESPIYKDIGLPPTYTIKDGELVMPNVTALKESVSCVFYRLTDPSSRMRIIAWEDFLKTIPRGLTSNSAGIGGITVTGKIDGNEIKIKTTSKAVIYPLSPDTFRPGADYGKTKFLTNDTLSEFYHFYDEDNPGRMAERRVVAKASRPIEMQQLSQYIVEYYIFGPLYRLMMKKDKDRSFNGYVYIHDRYGLMPDMNIFTVGSETGNVLVDHSNAFIVTGSACSRGTGTRKLFVATDYSSYDQTEVHENMRTPFRDGVVQGFNKRFGEGATVGAFDNIDTLLDVLMPPKVAKFKLPNGELIDLAGVRSGEYATMLYNNMMNASVCNAVINTVTGLGLGAYKSLRIQGDDVISEIDIPDEGAPLLDGGGSARMTKVRDMIDGMGVVPAIAHSTTQTVNESGLETNPGKGVVSFNTYDYLKIRVKAGRYSPNNYAQLFGSENLGMTDSPAEFMTGQIQKSDLVVSRGFDPKYVFRYQIMLFLVRCSYRVSIRNAHEDFSHYYYPPVSMFFSPTSMGGLGRSPWVYPFPADPAISYLMGINPEFEEFIQTRSGSYTAPSSRDYARLIAGLILKSESRSDFTVSSGISPLTIPPSDLMRPFRKGIVDLSASLDSSGITVSEASFHALSKKGISLVSPEMLYKNSPMRAIKNVLETNASVMQFAADKRKTIGQDAFMGSKSATLSKPEKWLRTFKFQFGNSDVSYAAEDPNGPLCYMHPYHRWFFDAVGWGSTSSDAQKKITTIINLVKTDPLFPRDITDEGVMRLLFSTEVAEDPRNAVLILGALGCTQETLAEVGAEFSESTTNAILLQYIAGAFNINSPCMMQLDRSRENLLRFVSDRSGNRTSRAIFPAVICIWSLMCYDGGSLKSLDYVGSQESDAFVNHTSIDMAIPFTPVFESSRMYAEHRSNKRI